MRKALVLFGALAIPGLAWAATPAASVDTTPQGALASQTVYEYAYDHAGRAVARHGKVYDADGTLVGRVEVAFTRDELGRIVRAETVRTDTDGNTLWRMVETMRYDALGALHKERTQWGADGAVVRREVEQRHDQPGGASPVWQTDVYGADGALEAVRFRTTDRDERGRVVAQDVSVFDAAGVQRSRVLTQWRYRKGQLVAQTRTTFDANDEVAKVSKGRREVVDATTTRWQWTDTDGAGRVVGSRQILETRDSAGHLVERVEAFRDADGQLVRTVTTQWAFDGEGRIEASRSHVVVFSPDSTF